MAADRFGSFSSINKHNSSGNWYQNPVNDTKHKNVDKELQRIRGLGVVSVRKRYEDVSSISSASSISNRASDSSNEFKYIKNKLSKDSQLSVDEPTAQHLSKEIANNTTGQADKLAVQTKQLRSNTDSQLPSANSDASITMSPRSYISESPTTTIKENKEEEAKAEMEDQTQNIPESHNLEQKQPSTGSEEDALNHIEEEEKSPAAAASDSVESIIGQAQPDRPMTDNEETSSRVDDKSPTVDQEEDELMFTPNEIPSTELSWNNEVPELRNTDTDKEIDIQQAVKPSEETAIESTLIQSEPHTADKHNSIANIVSEMHILAEKAKEISNEQDQELAEKLRIRDQMLKVVESLHVPDDAVNNCNDEAALQSELADLRRQVQELNLKCELQQVDLQERAAYHSKLKTEKEALVRKVSIMAAENTSESDSISKNLNRMSTGSTFSSFSQKTNGVPASRPSSRRLNSRPESPIPPQLPPPRDPLPPIPKDQQLPSISLKDTANRYSGVQIQTDHHERIVQDLLSKLREAQEEQTRSKAVIESLEIKLRKTQIKNLELEKSVRALGSERHELLSKQRASAPPPPLASPPQSSSPSTKDKKKRSRRSFGNLLSIFSKK
ncbi:hypothetical protein INT43_005563 [Umbelopsis isabellina]|uniref:Uncharacterized protein n=1 Tax=Mortierella isabellina TaxID=91625 RepID=A0A8H7PMV3_MORIS|nr:hypothetical protein INT43_005563 [Umbelopsis isabellina]